MTRLDIEKPLYSNAPQRTDPVWAVLCLWVGSVLLIGSGAVMLVIIASQMEPK
jgi:hypothetical protein